MIRLMLALALLQDDAVVQKHVTYQLKKPADSKLSVESACYFHPFTTPSGAVVTDVAPGDHKHHRGIFLAWFDMKGKKDADFWGWGMYAPVKDRVIVNRGVKKGDAATTVENHWLAEGETLLKETLTFGHRLEGAASVLDLTYVLSADGDVKIAKGAFSGFCLRMRKDGKATVEGPEGEVKRPAPHHMKPETDWPAQPWYGFQITLPDGAQLGGAVIDHPKNPPALWHNAASIRMINPCITAPGDVVIKAGEPLTLRYRVVAWDGAVPREQLSTLAKDWAK